MTKRPLPVLAIACLYLATGALALVYHLSRFKPRNPFAYDGTWASLVGLLALVAGAYMLRAANWARWLAIAWIAFHVVLSAFHSVSQLLFHALLCAVFAYFLFRPPANEYFSAAP